MDTLIILQQVLIVILGALLVRLYMGKYAVQLPWIEVTKDASGAEVKVLHLGSFDAVVYGLMAWLVYFNQYGYTFDLWLLLGAGLAARGSVAVVTEIFLKKGIDLKIP